MSAKTAGQMAPRLMNTKQAAAYLCASEGTVGMWAQLAVDPLPTVKLPNVRTRRFDVRDVDAWIDRRKECA